MEDEFSEARPVYDCVDNHGVDLDERLSGWEE